MGNTPRARATTPPKDEDDDVQDWDSYVAEASPQVKPFRKRMPDGAILTAGCPTSEALDQLTRAQYRGDPLGMLVAVFGREQAPKVLAATAKLPFTVRRKLVDDVMAHFGMSLDDVGESGASPR